MNTLKNDVLDALKETNYKTEHKNGIFTVWFHEGNGMNFRLSYHFRANKTKIVSYYTNGHTNTDKVTKVYEGLHIVTNHNEAQYLF